jgi:hypothetical protein
MGDPTSDRPTGDPAYARTHRHLPAPVAVWVRLDRVVTRYTASDYRRTTMRQRAYGIDLGAVVPGELLSWHQVETGGGHWWGVVRMTIGSRNGRLRLDLVQLVPADALTRRSPADGGPPSIATW